MIENFDKTDLLSFIHKFKETSDINKAQLARVISHTPDDNFYILETNKGPYCIYEVDYISSFEYARDNIYNQLGSNIEILQVIEPAKRKGIIKKYITRDVISQAFYYLLLIKIL